MPYPFLTAFSSRRLQTTADAWVGCATLAGLALGVMLIFFMRGPWLLLGFVFLYAGNIARWFRKQAVLSEFARSSPEVQIAMRTQSFTRALAAKLPMNKGTRLLPEPVLRALESIVQFGSAVEGRAVGQKGVRPEIASEAAEEAVRLCDHAVAVGSGARRQFAFLEFFPSDPSPEQVSECLTYLQPVDQALHRLMDALGEFEPEPAKQALSEARQLRDAQRHYVVNVLPPPR